MLKDFGYQIVGVSAPAKGNTLLNYCGIGRDLIDYIAEVEGSTKVGKFTPGSHIRVTGEDELIQDNPDYALILAWNWKDQIKKSLRKKGYRGCFIIPIPEVVIE